MCVFFLLLWCVFLLDINQSVIPLVRRDRVREREYDGKRHYHHASQTRVDAHLVVCRARFLFVVVPVLCVSNHASGVTPHLVMSSLLRLVSSVPSNGLSYTRSSSRSPYHPADVGKSPRE